MLTQNSKLWPFLRSALCVKTLSAHPCRAARLPAAPFWQGHQPYMAAIAQVPGTTSVWAGLIEKGVLAAASFQRSAVRFGLYPSAVVTVHAWRP
jgi:hypothetical protein